MAVLLVLADLQASRAIVDKDGRPTAEFLRLLNSNNRNVKVAFAAQAEFVDSLVELNDLITTVEAATAAAQTAADNAQAAADAIVVPPNGSRTVSADDSLTDDDYTILADASGGVITLTLPSAAASGQIIVTKIDASANAVNIAPAGADEINDSASSIAVTTQYQPRVLSSNGTSGWYG